MKLNFKIFIYILFTAGALLILTDSCKKDKTGDNTTGQVPVLSTTAVDSITPNTASCGGNITSDGGASVTARGVCWSTAQTPTISDSKTTDGTGYGNAIPFRTLIGGITGTVTDIDGNVYNTVTLGTQTWMVENLKVTKLNDNTPLTFATSNAEWDTLGHPGYCWYDDDTINKNIYGGLYNWSAVHTGKLAPAGWHVPSDEEWTILENFLLDNAYNYDSTTSGNKYAKALAAVILWTPSALPGVVGNTDFPAYKNKTSFTALPGGQRDYWGLCGYINYEGYWWTTTETYGTSALMRCMLSNSVTFMRETQNQRYGLSVRCLKD